MIADSKYSQKDLQNLMQYVDDGLKRVNGAKKIIMHNTDEFDIWKKYLVEEELYDYKSMFGIDTLIRRTINKYMSWLTTEEYRGRKLELEYLVESFEMLFEEEKINKSELELLKKELMNLNFGSMLLEW